MSRAGTPNIGTWLSNQGGLQGMALWGDPQAAYDAGVNVNEPGAYTLYCSMGSNTVAAPWLCIVTENEHGTGLGTSDYWTLVIAAQPAWDYTLNSVNLLSAGNSYTNTSAEVDVPDGIARIDGTMQVNIQYRTHAGNDRCDWEYGFIDNGGSGTYIAVGFHHDIGAHYNGASTWSRPASVTDWRPGSGGSYQGAIHPRVLYSWEANTADHLNVHRWTIQFTPRLFIPDVS